MPTTKTAPPAPLATSIGGGGTSQLLAVLQQDTTASLENLATQKTSAQELDDKIAEMQRQVEEAAAIRDPAKRNARMRILQSTLEELRAQDAKDNGDIATAVYGISLITKNIGGEFDNLSAPSQAEKDLDASAAAAVTAAQTAVESAKKKWQIFGFQARAVKAATADLELAMTAQVETKEKIAKMARERLQSASLEDSMQVLRTMTTKLVALVEDRHKTTAKQLKIVTARKDEAFKIKGQAAQLFEKLEADLAGVEIDLGTATTNLGLEVNGSEAWVAAEKIVSDLKAKAEETRGKMEVAKTVLMSKELFASDLQIHESATQKIFHNQSIWIAKLKSDSEEREVTWANRLASMQAINDFEVMANVDAVASEIDLQGAEAMATAGALLDRQRQEMHKKQPGKMRRLEEILTTSAEHDAKVFAEDAALVAELRQRWGLDPANTSYLNKGSGDPSPAGAEPAAV